ncbi:acyl-CoA reductase-like NAD-dependent aldehyde dehydrogenase [Paraburkholderia sp. MM5496-R1]
MSYIELGSQEGAHLVCGGERLKALFKTDYFVTPTVFADVHDEMRIARDEIFCPFFQ